MYSYHLLLCFLLCRQFLAFEKDEEDRIKKDGQVVSPSLFYMKQTIGNACGTVGLLHAIGNCTDKIALSKFEEAALCLSQILLVLQSCVQGLVRVSTVYTNKSNLRVTLFLVPSPLKLKYVYSL